MTSRTTPEFWRRFYRLPKEVRRLARKNYFLWLNDPGHASLRFKRFKRGQWSARVGARYRAVGAFTAKNDFQWTWIGTHEDYNKL